MDSANPPPVGVSSSTSGATPLPSPTATAPAPASTPTAPALASPHSHGGHSTWLLALGALGVVYGDIGTSPLYAFRECFVSLAEGKHAGLQPTKEQILGVLSLITWSLVVVVICKYLLLALRADNRGEGGILALLALLTSGGATGSPGGGPEAKPELRRGVIVIALIAAALLFADGLITPAISVLSAVEGLEVQAPGLKNWVVPITAGILLALFLIQSHGTGKIGVLFGPLTLVWFVSIAVLGAIQIVQHPSVLAALSPTYAMTLALHDPMHAFTLLGAVVLVVTGGEALYADMGHFGRAAIRRAWFCVVFPALLLNYYGQAAGALEQPGAADNPFWAIVPVPIRFAMILIATMATIIASQALISGAYSLTQQAMQLGYSPRFQIVHTSHKVVGQIFVPEINTIMMIFCVLLVAIFQESTRLAAMYGLAVTGTMTITSMLLYCVAREKWNWTRRKATIVFGLLLAVDLTFLASNLLKLDDGGWVALLMASAVLTFMLVWYEGRRLLARPAYSLSVPMQVLLADLQRQKMHRVPGTAVFLAARPGVVPAVLLHHLKHNQVLHERVIMLSVRTDPVPKVDEKSRLTVKELTAGFWEVTSHYGFMESPDVPEVLRACAGQGLQVDPELVTYYLGRVVLRMTERGGMSRWAKKLFTFLYHNERPVTAFFNLPANRVVELGRQVEL